MNSEIDLANAARLLKVVANRTRLAALLALQSRPQCVHDLVATLELQLYTVLILRVTS